MMKTKDFAVFILTYGRPNNVITFETLRRGGYTGKIYLLCSDDDKTITYYQKNFENVIVFNKEQYSKQFDIGDNFTKNNVVVFARNANFGIAKELGIKYFLQLDDDYQIIEYKIPSKEMLIGRRVKNLDILFNSFIQFQKETGAKSIAFGQGGDYIGGKDNDFYVNNGRRRKVMNSFFNVTTNPYQFYGRINEDCTCYLVNGMRGDLFLTIPYVSLKQKQTQANEGGLSEFYLETGTYYKSFYSIIFHPSAVKVRLMGESHQRLHHNIQWKNAVPVIIREEYKKKADKK